MYGSNSHCNESFCFTFFRTGTVPAVFTEQYIGKEKEMKKLLCVLSLSLAFASVAMCGTFTVDDYKAGYATIPVMYKGTLSMDGFSSSATACNAVKKKSSYPAYLAICQPCLDCYYNCMAVDGSDYNAKYSNPNGLEPKGISGVLVYVVDVDRKAKTVSYMTIDVDECASFFNYNYSSVGNRQIAFWQTQAVADEPFFASIGVKDSKQWKIGKTISMKASVAKSFDGKAFFGTTPSGNASAYAFDGGDGDFATGTIKLNRDDSTTKKMMGTLVNGICANIPCEDFIDVSVVDYVLGKSYKGYDLICVDEF